MSSSNLPSITIKDLVDIVKMQINERNYRPIFALGKGGIGKTESIEHLAKNELNIGYIDIRLLLYSETDLKGIPYPDENHVKTIWLQNNILPTVERDGDMGILVFDEITSCGRSVRTAAYQLLNERRLGEYVLPDGWLVVCLGNGEDDGGDYAGMEGNFANRCSVYNVVPNVEAWKLWAMKNGINELVTAYVSFKPEDLHSYNPESETELLFSSPRSWTAVSNIINSNGYDENNRINITRIIANVGQRVGDQFVAFCKYRSETVDPMTIVKDGKRPQVRQQEVLFILMQSVIKIVGDQIKEDISKLHGIQQQTLQYTANALKWILSLDKPEHKVMGFKDLIAYDEGVMRRLMISSELNAICPEIIKFATENEEIFR